MTTTRSETTKSDARPVVDAHDATRRNLVYLMRKTLNRLADAEDIKTRWFEGRDEYVLRVTQSPSAEARGISRVDALQRWMTSPQAGGLAADQRWAVDESTMYAVNALVLQNETLMEQNATIITLLQEIATTLDRRGDGSKTPKEE